MKLSKIIPRQEPIIRAELVAVTHSEWEFLTSKFCRGYDSTGLYTGELIGYKAKSAHSLTCDRVEISKIVITQVVNNCGLSTGMHYRVTYVMFGTLTEKRQTYYYRLL